MITLPIEVSTAAKKFLFTFTLPIQLKSPPTNILLPANFMSLTTLFAFIFHELIVPVNKLIDAALFLLTPNILVNSPPTNKVLFTTSMLHTLPFTLGSQANAAADAVSITASLFLF